MRLRPVIVWVVAGLLGLVLAAAVSYAATQLSSQRIGLAAEPPSAGEELAPAPARTTKPPARPSQTRPAPRVPTTTTTSTAPAPAPPAAPPAQSSPAPATPSGGSADDGGGAGGGRGGDD